MFTQKEANLKIMKFCISSRYLMKQETLIKLIIISSQSLWFLAETVYKKGIKLKNKNLH